jgi:HlyD family secretion protein
MSTTVDLPRVARAATTRGRPNSALSELIEREERRRRRRHLLYWLLALALPAIAMAAWAALRPRPVPMSARYRIEAVSAGDVVREVSATGRVEAESTVSVGAEISGRLSTVEVDYNARVRAGQVMARFERASLEAQLAQIEAAIATAQAQLAQARTDRDQAQRNLQRAARLHAVDVVSEADHDAATFALRGAENRIRLATAQLSAQQAAARVARINLDHAVIRAPIDGVVITRNVDPGQAVAAMLQTPVLFSLAADLRRMRVVAAVDEADIGQVVAGQPAEFTVNAYPERVFRGTVIEVRNAPIVVQDVVTYGTVVEVDNPDLALKPGMTASARIRTGVARGVLRVPSTALHFNPPGESSGATAGVWVLDGARVRRVEVQPGMADAAYTSIAPGPLAPGASVLVGLTPAGRRSYGINH